MLGRNGYLGKSLFLFCAAWSRCLRESQHLWSSNACLSSVLCSFSLELDRGWCFCHIALWGLNRVVETSREVLQTHWFPKDFWHLWLLCKRKQTAMFSSTEQSILPVLLCCKQTRVKCYACLESLVIQTGQNLGISEEKVGFWLVLTVFLEVSRSTAN